MNSGNLSSPCFLLKLMWGDQEKTIRKTINGILYVLITGCRWMDMPREYGSHKTAWRRLKEWEKTGIWERMRKGVKIHAAASCCLPLSIEIGAGNEHDSRKFFKVGRPSRFKERNYKMVERNVDRFFGWLKCGFRRFALRYERPKTTFFGFLHIACFIISWRILR